MFGKSSQRIHDRASNLATHSIARHPLLIIGIIGALLSLTIANCSSDEANDDTNSMTQAGTGGNGQVVDAAAPTNTINQEGISSQTNTGGTTYPADMDRGLYTLFRPDPPEEGKKYPVITWGNGTCSQPLLFSEILEHLASYGYFIIATNTRQTASGEEMLHGIDFMLAENDNPSSALFGKIDTEMLGATGHSQGSMATVVVGADPRIVATVSIQGATVGGAADLKGPTFLIAGDKDTTVSASSVEAAFNVATVPAVYGLSIGNDHLMPGLNPSEIWDAVTAWFEIHLKNDTQARDYFYGDQCRLCNDPTNWQIKRKKFIIV